MYLGFDIGTSSIKAVLVDEADRAIASETAPLSVSRPHPGWSEQEPQDWWRAATATMAGLNSTHRKEFAAVEAIGLAGQMHGATLLDAEDKPLRPCILWNDGRSEPQCAELERAEPRSRSITGNIAMPGFTAPKLLWVKSHDPDIFGRISKILLPKDYVRLKLTGEHVSDMSDSAGTLWLDTRDRAWSPDMLRATGLSERAMPRLVEGTEISARLRRDLSSELGFAKPPVVAGGAGDNAAAACGVGAVTPGAAFVSLGTSGVLFVSNERFSPNTDAAVHAFCHALPGTWHQMGVMLSAASALQWWANVAGRSESDLLAAVPAKPDVPGPVFFLPYLSGERTPHNDARVRAVFTGLGHDSGTAAMTQAVLEGVAFAFRDCLEALTAAGTPVARLTAVGGGARSAAWLDILANVLERPIDQPRHGEFGAAFGAARLARLAAHGEKPADVCRAPPIARTFEPRPGATAVYREAHTRWRRLYPAVKDLGAA